MTSNNTLIIREATLADAPALKRLFSSTDVLNNTSLPLHSANAFVNDLLQRENCIRLVAELDNQVVGQLSLATSPKPRVKHIASLAIAVHADFQCRGIGKALMAEAINMADNWLNLVRLELDVYTDNEHAVALYQQFGFEIEGTRICGGFKQGRYVDNYTMARIKPGTRD